MSARRTLMLTLLAVSACVTVMSGSSSARMVEIPNFERGYRLVATFVATPPIGAPIRCRITLNGIYHARTHAKTAGLLVGRVVSFQVEASCVGLTIPIAMLPWHRRYRGFTGTLPTMTATIEGIVGMQLVLQNEVARCTVTTTEANPAVIIDSASREGGGGLVYTTGRFDESFSIPLSGGFPCELGSVTFSGSGPITTAEGATLRLRLI